MYDELIKRMRRCAVYLPEKFSKNAEMLDVLMKAADAIEELSRKNESLAKSVNEASDILRHRWIPVEERLPTPREKVLVAYKKGVTIAQMDGYIRTPQKEIHYWRGMNGPKHTLASVTHWMPLSEPPKEE